MIAADRGGMPRVRIANLPRANGEIPVVDKPLLPGQQASAVWRLMEPAVRGRAA